jgi:hypothetical protein
MDFSVVTAAMSALTTARTLGQTLVGLRDFNESAAVVAQLNGELLRAQESLFSLSAQLHELQHENFQTAEELKGLRERLIDRARYALHELSQGVFVYRSNGATATGDSEPVHYLCQPCFDKGAKAVLVYSLVTGHRRCPICRTDY